MKKWMKFLVITIVIFGALPIIGNIDASETKNEEKSSVENKASVIDLEGLFNTSAWTGNLGTTPVVPNINEDIIHFAKPNIGGTTGSNFRQSGSITSKVK